MIAALDARDPRIPLYHLVHALGASPNPRAYLRAISALQDKDPEIRHTAARMFAKGVSYGIGSDGAHYVPDGGFQALKDPRVIKPLTALITEPQDDCPHAEMKKWIHESATTALRKTNDPQALEFLQRMEGKQTEN